MAIADAMQASKQAENCDAGLLKIKVFCALKSPFKSNHSNPLVLESASGFFIA